MCKNEGEEVAKILNKLNFYKYKCRVYVMIFLQFSNFSLSEHHLLRGKFILLLSLNFASTHAFSMHTKHCVV